VDVEMDNPYVVPVQQFPDAGYILVQVHSDMIRDGPQKTRTWHEKRTILQARAGKRKRAGNGAFEKLFDK
jgi:hypothetical protein